MIFNGQKFRFRRLGYTEERFESLEKSGRREKAISTIREDNPKTRNVGRIR